ncbi:hypothetical protein YUYDRAFT_01855 [Streptomyces sp. ScaeMP-e48]|nr:hypothetical protein YUYDRAFT_01855 [Streptomyces sp. ScaeMP-e48]
MSEGLNATEKLRTVRGLSEHDRRGIPITCVEGVKGVSGALSEHEAFSAHNRHSENANVIKCASLDGIGPLHSTGRTNLSNVRVMLDGIAHKAAHGLVMLRYFGEKALFGVLRPGRKIAAVLRLKGSQLDGSRFALRHVVSGKGGIKSHGELPYCDG